MLQDIIDFNAKLDDPNIIMEQGLKEIVQKFNFCQILKTNNYDHKILQKINESEVIVIDTYSKSNIEYYIICFERQLIIIEQTDERITDTLFSKSNKKKTYYIPKMQLDLQTNFFNEEINNFKRKFIIHSKFNRSITNFWQIIKPCLSGYLIKKGYLESYKDRIDEFINNAEEQIKPTVFNKEEFIYLRNIANSQSSKVTLNYHIKNEKIFVIKTFLGNKKLSEREIDNYKTIRYPFLPKYYGTMNDDGCKSIVIEFINGKTLNCVNEKEMSFEQKIKIVIEFLYTFQYLHRTNFIYRDIKPNNLIINCNQQIVVIDFDRMIKKDQKPENEQFTLYFQPNFVDPEINTCTCIPSFQNDIYSIGKIIYFIMIGDSPENSKTSDFEIKYPEIYDIYIKCINSNKEDRPSITKLIKCFTKCISNNKRSNLYNIKKNIKLCKLIDCLTLSINENDSNAQFFLGHTYLKSKYVIQNINKAIHYLSLAADQNHLKAQALLGGLYFLGNCVTRDIEKAIRYLTYAANKNESSAQNSLGMIYYLNDYVARDINKAIYYLSLAANNNIPNAQNYLGIIYYEGKYVIQDIDKAIHYFTLAANQNESIAQDFLGVIYYNGISIAPDIDKAIHYFTLAANQNRGNAQNYLGIIFYEGKYVTRDINKAMYFFSLAANQNDYHAKSNLAFIHAENKYIAHNSNKNNYSSFVSNHDNQNDQYKYGLIYNKGIHNLDPYVKTNDSDMQCILGYIYYHGNDVKQDINKSIHYFTLAANQNDINAQKYLGIIYYDDKYIPRNINKSIYYLTLAANQNDTKAQLYLGIIYYEGKYVTRDINKAIYYLTLASNQNDISAQNYFGILYYEGKYITRDINKSLHYFTLSSNQNDAFAQKSLGIIYYDGIYVERDINKAIHYFMLASNQNFSEAQFNLGWIYYENKYIPRNINK